MSFEVKLDATLKKDVALSESRYDFRIYDLLQGEDEYKHITKDYGYSPSPTVREF